MTDRQKLSIAGAVAALATAIATVLIVRHFTPPAHTLERTPAPDLREAVQRLVDELRQLPQDALQAHLLPPLDLEGVQPNIPALAIAFDALAEGEGVEVARVQSLGDGVVEATVRYVDPDGETAQMTLLIHHANGRLIPLTLTR
ncbi:hypothetical protein HQ560_13415 [bacterium]|nr:hypothetical protein [bacterium]